IQHLKPAQIYHIAGNIGGRHTTHDPQQIWADNLHATLNLYEACLQASCRPRILYLSSGAVYGEQPGELVETLPLLPKSIYAASKAAADLASYTYFIQKGLPILRVRLFNYLGPDLPASTALGRFIHELSRFHAEDTSNLELTVGNLSSERDYLDINDAITALTQLMEQGQPGEAYNLARGISKPMSWYLQQLTSMCAKSVRILEDPHQLRHHDTFRLQVNIDKLSHTCSWKPAISIEESLKNCMTAAVGKSPSNS
ncbi:MAG TPA: NAD(P)-dependent oxidoreductase, partial [Gemmatales bacterium]|nr:NAD(P)-dependent oxidoreductase [Gemmatales bacterium]